MASSPTLTRSVSLSEGAFTSAFSAGSAASGGGASAGADGAASAGGRSGPLRDLFAQRQHFLDQRADPVRFQRGEFLMDVRELRVDLGDALLPGLSKVALA